MAYDERLAQTLRDGLHGRRGVSEKRMMGGLCFLVHGNMICGIDRSKNGVDRFMFRVGKDNEALALRLPGASIVDMGGKRIGGFIFVTAEACHGAALSKWLALATAYTDGLPKKIKR